MTVEVSRELVSVITLGVTFRFRIVSGVIRNFLGDFIVLVTTNAQLMWADNLAVVVVRVVQSYCGIRVLLK